MRTLLLPYEVNALRQWCTSNLGPVVTKRRYNPKSLAELIDDRLSTDDTYVFGGGSKQTIFNSGVYGNWGVYYYRAWHDSMHIRYGLEFTREDELALAEMLEYVALNELGFTEHSAKLLRVDLELHIKHYYKFNKHPDKQRGMIESYLVYGEERTLSQQW